MDPYKIYNEVLDVGGTFFPIEIDSTIDGNYIYWGYLISSELEMKFYLKSDSLLSNEDHCIIKITQNFSSLYIMKCEDGNIDVSMSKFKTK